MAFGIFKKFNFGLKKTRESMSGAIDAAISENEDITDQLYDDLEGQAEMLALAKPEYWELCGNPHIFRVA